MIPNWKNVLVLPDAPLKEILETIDAGALRIALVADEGNLLLGTITDGDIRRALIRNLDMEQPARELMNTNPTVVDRGVSKHELISIMESKALIALPIVDNGQIIGIETLQDILHQSHYENPVFIMAGGFGKRLHPLTTNCPKPLLKVGDKPILETTIAHFINHGFRNFFISTHYMSEMIMEHFGHGEGWGVNITYIHEESPLGTGGALALLPEDIPHLPLIMMNGDILTSLNFQNLLRFHEKHGASATMCVREYSYQIPYGVIEGSEGMVTHMVEKPTRSHHVNAGIYVINPDIISKVEMGEKIDMPCLLERAMANSQEVRMFPIHEYWLDIGRLEDFQRAQLDIQELGI